MSQLSLLQTTAALTDLPEPLQAMLDSINLYWLADQKSKKRELRNVIAYLKDQWDQVCKNETDLETLFNFRMVLCTAMR